MWAHLVLEVSDKEVDEVRPALLRSHMHSGALVAAADPGGAPHAGQALHCFDPVPGGRAVQRGALVPVLHHRVTALCSERRHES